MTTEAAAAYRDGRERIIATLREAGERAVDAAVPARPGRNPKDVASHLTGVCADILAGRLDETGIDTRTAARVAERRSRSLEEVLDEWSDVGPQVEQLLPSFPGWAADQLVSDLLSHERALTEALGQQHVPIAP